MTSASLAAIRLSEATRRLADCRREVAACEKEARASFEAEHKDVSMLYTYVASNGVISELSHLAQSRAGIFDISTPTTTTLSEKPEDLADAMGKWGF